MVVKVRVENGVLRLPEGVDLPEGTEFEVQLPTAIVQRSFTDRFAKYIGMADDMPPDLAENLDHYLHGQPKK